MERTEKLLALETTDVAGSVALSENGRVVELRTTDEGRRSAQTLAPVIDALLKAHDWRPSDVDVVAVTVGPGSFTGLRVGVTTARLFAWAVDAKIVAVDALDAILAAYVRSDSTFERPTLVSAGIDAQRGDSAIRSWLVVPGFDGLVVHPLSERFHVVATKRWLGEADDVPFFDALSDEIRAEAQRASEKLPNELRTLIQSATAKDVLFTGPALLRVSRDAENLEARRLAPEEYWRPNAAGVAFVAREKSLRGEYDDVWNTLPLYSRRAAAEEKRIAREKK